MHLVPTTLTRLVQGERTETRRGLVLKTKERGKSMDMGSITISGLSWGLGLGLIIGALGMRFQRKRHERDHYATLRAQRDACEEKVATEIARAERQGLAYRREIDALKNEALLRPVEIITEIREVPVPAAPAAEKSAGKQSRKQKKQRKNRKEKKS